MCLINQCDPRKPSFLPMYAEHVADPLTKDPHYGTSIIRRAIIALMQEIPEWLMQKEKISDLRNQIAIIESDDLTTLAQKINAKIIALDKKAKKIELPDRPEQDLYLYSQFEYDSIRQHQIFWKKLDSGYRLSKWHLPRNPSIPEQLNRACLILEFCFFLIVQSQKDLSPRCHASDRLSCGFNVEDFYHRYTYGSGINPTIMSSISKIQTLTMLLQTSFVYFSSTHIQKTMRRISTVNDVESICTTLKALIEKAEQDWHKAFSDLVEQSKTLKQDLDMANKELHSKTGFFTDTSEIDTKITRLRGNLRENPQKQWDLIKKYGKLLQDEQQINTHICWLEALAHDLNASNKIRLIV